MHLTPTAAIIAAAACALVTTPAAAGCSSAFCVVNSDWTSESAAASEGQALDLRYERIDLDQPRAGSRKVGSGEGVAAEDEIRTRNRNLVATYSRLFASGWGLSVTAPVVRRDHLHIDNTQSQPQDARWKFTGAGDLRVVGRYQTALVGSDGPQPRRAGVLFGLKLPTGRIRIANPDGDLAERSLQPGTGTTDAILGGYLHQDLSERGAAWFAQAQVQRALNSKEGFRPGAQLGIDIGYAQAATDRLSLLLQLNLVARGRDRGDEAEPEESGGRSAHLSPGLSYALTERLRAYAFFQQPLYQHVNGVQLTARHAVVLGLTARF